MRWIITEPRGVNVALINPAATDGNIDDEFVKLFCEPELRCLDWIQPAVEGVRENRLSIYAEGYFTRIYDCLADENFSTLREEVGTDEFRNLVANFIARNPSQYWNIEDLSHDFSRYVSEYFSEEDRREFLSELALFEWLLVKTFYANRSSGIDASAIQRIQNWETVCFKFSDNIIALELEWPVYDAWRLRKNNMEFVFTGVPKRQFVIISRGQDGLVDVELVNQIKFNVLISLMTGTSLEKALESLPNHETMLQNIQTWFQDWVSSGVILEIN